MYKNNNSCENIAWFYYVSKPWSSHYCIKKFIISFSCTIHIYAIRITMVHQGSTHKRVFTKLTEDLSRVALIPTSSIVKRLRPLGILILHDLQNILTAAVTTSLSRTTHQQAVTIVLRSSKFNPSKEWTLKVAYWCWFLNAFFVNFERP